MIIRQPVAVRINILDSAVFHCSVQSFGNVKVTWRKERYLLPATSSERISKSKNIVTSRLKINRAVGYYSGRYYCEAENIAGKVISTLTYLNVTGKHH